MKVEYSSNNSGGKWWLKDKDWEALEGKGWRVDWFRDEQGDWASLFRDGRWLGALARSASKEFPTMREAIEEWEVATGASSSDLGCSCCGTPHSFSSDTGEYYSPQYPSQGERY